MIPTTVTPNAESLKISEEQKKTLGNWLMQEIEDAIAARAPMEASWRELLRLYEGVPKQESRNTPIVNAPNIEVTLGAIACDAIFAQVLDLIYQVSPIITVRANDDVWAEHAKSMQRFVNWLSTVELKLRPVSEQVFIDCVQLGTGIYYVPWTEVRRKTKVSATVLAQPRVRSVAPEDFLVPGGASEDLQEARWCAMRVYLTRYELEERAALAKWDISEVKTCATRSWTRHRREQMGKTSNDQSTPESYPYEILDVYVHYDIDGDGQAEDLLITWDRTSRSILKIQYNPYDQRPFIACRYQPRAHLFWGNGVMEMTRPFQNGATELYCHWIINLMLANTRLWKGREGVIPSTMEVWPSKVVTMPDPTSDLMGEQMADTYPSAPTALITTVNFAQQRVGVSDLSSNRPAELMGSRTPGITALTAVQQINKRFTPAFDAMRGATSDAVRMALYRYREQVLAGDQLVTRKLQQLLGAEEGQRVITLLQLPDFSEQIAVELTASSASVNRDADKQNMVMLAQTILAPYYQRCIELAMLAANPQLPPQVKMTIEKVAQAMGEGVDLIIRTFEQVRDPAILVVRMNEILQMQQVQTGLEGLLGGAGGMPMGGNPGQPPGGSTGFPGLPGPGAESMLGAAGGGSPFGQEPGTESGAA